MEERREHIWQDEEIKGRFTNTKLLLDQLGFRLFIHHFDYLPT